MYVEDDIIPESHFLLPSHEVVIGQGLFFIVGCGSLTWWCMHTHPAMGKGCESIQVLCWSLHFFATDEYLQISPTSGNKKKFLFYITQVMQGWTQPFAYCK
jgi:hypothetical protein